MEGIARYVYETTYHMAIAHPNDMFFIFYDRYSNERPHFPANVHHFTIPLPTRHPILWYIWFEFLIPLYLKIHKIDVFYSGDGFLSLTSKVPTVMALHDLAYIHYPQHIDVCVLKFYKKFVPKYIDKASALVTVSHFVKKDIIDHFKIPEQKIVVAYNAINTHIQTDVTSKPDLRNELLNVIKQKPYFIYVGALHPRKNIINMIQAFDIFNERHQYKYNFILAGRLAWKTNEITHQIKSSPNSWHLGIVSEDEKILLIKNAVCLLYVSTFEGFGIPILEAMSLGTPVITSDVASMPEIAGNAALLSDPNDIYAIADHMQNLVSNSDLYQTCVSRGCNRCRDFSWKISAEKIYSTLKQFSNLAI